MDTMNKLVSIIIPIYKKEDTLASCLDSVLAQSYMDLEVILVNDCSPDNCLAICKEYCKNYNTIKLIDIKENRGVSYARNQGLSISSGEYITFVDADDIVDANYIQEMVQQIGDADILMTSIYKDYNGEVIELTQYDAIDYIYRKDGYEGGVVGKLFRSDIALKNEFPIDVKIGEDAYFLYNSILCSNKFFYYKRQLYHVGKSQYNSGGWMPFDKIYDTVRLLKYIVRKTDIVFGQCPISAYVALFERSINVYMRSKYRDIPPTINDEIKENVKDYYKRFRLKGLPVRYIIAGLAYTLFPSAYANIVYKLYTR